MTEEKRQRAFCFFFFPSLPLLLSYDILNNRGVEEDYKQRTVPLEGSLEPPPLILGLIGVFWVLVSLAFFPATT